MQRITLQNFTIQGHVPRADKYNTTLHNTRERSKNSTIKEYVPHSEKYNTIFYNTRVRSTYGKI